MAVEERLLRLSELQQLIPYTKVSIYRLEKKQAGFPKRIHLGPGRVAWKLSEVLAYIESRDNLKKSPVQRPESVPSSEPIPSPDPLPAPVLTPEVSTRDPYTYRIDRGIKVPCGGHTWSKERTTLRELRVGESFFAAGVPPLKMAGIIQSMRTAGVQFSTWKFTTRARTEDGLDGVRVWRTA
jgi:prophage regulatory protein